MAFTITSLIMFIIDDMIQPAILLISSLVIVYFIWSIAEVVRKGDQQEELSKLKEKAVWGIIAIAIMFSVWGLVEILTSTFFTAGANYTPAVPRIPQ